MDCINCSERVRGPILRYAVFLLSVCLIVALGMGVSAAAPEVNWTEPALNGSYRNSDFAAGVATDIGADCYLLAYYGHNGTIVMEDYMDGNGTGAHSLLLAMDIFLPGYAYTINVTCSDSLAPENSTSVSTYFLRDPRCGESLDTNWTLGKDLTCDTTGSGISLRTSGISLDCANHSITNSGRYAGTGIDISADGVSVNGCDVSGFSAGIASRNTLGISIISNELHDNYLGPMSGIYLENVTGSAVSLNDIYSNDEGIYLSGCSALDISMNNIYSNSQAGASALGLFDAGGNTNISLSSNYWGHGACPLYSFMVDSNSADIIDSSPAANLSGWDQTTDCSLQENSGMLQAVSLLKPDGSATSDEVFGKSYFYDGDNIRQDVSAYPLEMGGQNVTAWKVYQYFYYPGQDIILEINASPANYRIEDISLFTSGLSDYSLSVVNITGPDMAAGVYRINLSGYSLNESDPLANGSYGIRELDLRFMITDDLGSVRWVRLLGVYNFTITQAEGRLGAMTTEWSSISDFTDVSGLTFVYMSGNYSLARLRFMESLNLADADFVHGLRSLSSNLRAGNLSVSLNSSALLALNRSANITFYGVSQEGMGLASNFSRKVKLDGAPCPSGVCGNFSYSNDTLELSFRVGHWSNYTLDLMPPKILSKDPTMSDTISSSTTHVHISVITDENATCRYDSEDGIAYGSMDYLMAGNGTEHSAVKNVTSGTTYYLYVKCRDMVNNSMAKDENIRFEIQGSASETTGGGAKTSEEATPLYGDVGYGGKRVAISRNEVYKFRINGSTENHNIRIISISEGSVTFMISSSTINATVRLGETKPVDFTDDGKADMTIKVVSVSDYGVAFILTKVESSAAAAAPGGTGDETIEEANNTGTSATAAAQSAQKSNNATGESQATQQQSAGKTANEEVKAMVIGASLMNYIWIGLSALLILIVLAVVITAVVRWNKNRPKKGEIKIEPPVLQEEPKKNLEKPIIKKKRRWWQKKDPVLKVEAPILAEPEMELDKMGLVKKPSSRKVELLKPEETEKPKKKGFLFWRK